MINVQPSLGLDAFSCPHCNAYTTQTWYRTYASAMKSAPTVMVAHDVESADLSHFKDPEAEAQIRSLWRRLAAGEVFVFDKRDSTYCSAVGNIHLSVCFHCAKAAVWLYDLLTWPATAMAISPSADMPELVRRDLAEAAMIVNASPRGAAALLRLSLQQLCKELGGKGRNINDDIAAMVDRGLDPRVQQALDVVRVIGNNAVHPGEIDLSDDRDIANQLFSLVNLIVDIMITQPAHVQRMYDNLPSGALAAIARRDGS